MMTDTDPRLLLLHPDDNVLVLRATIKKAETVAVAGENVTMQDTIGLGHKLARQAIKAGEKVLKYGVSIGSASRDIAVGAHVHLDNLTSDYTPTYALDDAKAQFGTGT